MKSKPQEKNEGQGAVKDRERAKMRTWKTKRDAGCGEGAEWAVTKTMCEKEKTTSGGTQQKRERVAMKGSTMLLRPGSHIPDKRWLTFLLSAPCFTHTYESMAMSHTALGHDLD